MSTFLTSAEVIELTGRKVKSKQIEALRSMGLPFWVNAIGKPVVATAAIEGRKETPKQQTWVMPKINNGPKKHS
jgi:hypothetical protein